MKPKLPSQAQSERFEQAARDLGVELDEVKLREALRKIAPMPPKEDDGRKDGNG